MARLEELLVDLFATAFARRARAACLCAVAFALVACEAPSSTSSGARPPTCRDDLDCHAGAYCTVAGLCRTDCFTDKECLGPAAASQCNAQGRCIEGVGALDASRDAPAEASADAGRADADASLADR